MFSSTSTTDAVSILPAAQHSKTSFEDQEMRRLHESGDLVEVAGSQSLLSQELELSQQAPEAYTQESYNDDSDQAMLSTAHAVAQRYGILTQDDEQQHNENQENAPENIKSQATDSESHNHDPHYDYTVEKDSSTTAPPLTLPASLPLTLSLSQESSSMNINIMDLVMELDDSFTGLDAMRQAARVQQTQQAKSPQDVLPFLTSSNSMNKNVLQASKDNVSCKMSTTSTSQPASTSTSTSTSASTNTSTSTVFTSLLDAVHAVQSQSTPQRCSPRLLQSKQKQHLHQNQYKNHLATGTKLFGSPERLTPAEVAAANNKMKQPRATKKKAPASKTQNSTSSMKRIHPILNSPMKPQPTPTSPGQVMAQRAANLAVRVSSDADLAKQLLLSMALTRDNPRQIPAACPPTGHVLEDGFFWAHYPPLEQILKDSMSRYYELSMAKCQSPQQQAFNNTLVVLVRAQVANRSWSFDHSFCSDKVLRDRIRCYYKSHIQNAKKRLRTMLRNPTKKSNSKHLMQHWGLIRETIVLQQEMGTQIGSSTRSKNNGHDDKNGETEEAANKPIPRRVTMEDVGMTQV
jgi:hypothetical protein